MRNWLRGLVKSNSTVLPQNRSVFLVPVAPSPFVSRHFSTASTGMEGGSVSCYEGHEIEVWRVTGGREPEGTISWGTLRILLCKLLPVSGESIAVMIGLQAALPSRYILNIKEGFTGEEESQPSL